MQRLRAVGTQVTTAALIARPEENHLNSTLIVSFAAVLIAAWFACRYVAWPWAKLEWRRHWAPVLRPAARQARLSRIFRAG